MLKPSIAFVLSGTLMLGAVSPTISAEGLGAAAEAAKGAAAEHTAKEVVKEKATDAVKDKAKQVVDEKLHGTAAGAASEAGSAETAAGAAGLKH